MKLAVILLLVAVSVSASVASSERSDASLDQRWQAYKVKFEKQYKDVQEEVFRREIWEKNLKIIEQHNKEAAEGKHTYNMAENHLTDRTPEELGSMLMHNH